MSMHHGKMKHLPSLCTSRKIEDGNDEDMRVALGQIDLVPNRPKRNLERMMRIIDDAKRQRVDLIAFPPALPPTYCSGPMISR